MDLDAALNISDLGRLARRRLPRVIFDFLDGGAEDKITLRANREGFAHYRFRPRILTANAKRDLSGELFGQSLSLPFVIWPTGLNGIHWRGADIALARAAAGTAFSLSTASTSSIEEVGACSGGVKWIQLYPWADGAFCERLVERAKAAGYSVLLVTVDSVNAGRRERDARNRFAHEVTLTPRTVIDGLMHPRWLTSVWLRGRGMPRMPNLSQFLPEGAGAAEMSEFTRTRRNPMLDWDDMAFLKRTWGGPMLVKGRADRGGRARRRRYQPQRCRRFEPRRRQLDGSLATIEALPEAVAAAAGKTVLIDGGFRRGSDLVKVLALGAKGSSSGTCDRVRVAAAGEASAARALSILAAETDRALALLGCPSVGEVGKAHVVHTSSLAANAH